nr:8208_t:CDS:2 [Entrophospora candida]
MDTTMSMIREATKNSKVWDHDHISGKYQGVAHSGCNLHLKINPIKEQILVIFHNFRGYDSHLVCQSAGKASSDQILVIAENIEKYKSMTIGKFKFIDSIQFMNTGLRKLVENLGAVPCNNNECKEHKFRIDKNQCMGRPEAFKTLNKLIGDTDKVTLLLRKGVYPYDWVDSSEKFNTKELPSIEYFHSTLSGTITPEDYKHANLVWEKFGCKTFGDYHDIYLKADVMQLCDVFETFRDTAMEYYEIDPAYYISMPSFAWDAMLKYTNIELDLFTDALMHDVTESQKHGGVSMVSKRYGKANNPKCSGYDKNRPKKYLMYVDTNNLYGWAMSQYLPSGGFKWINPNTAPDIMSIPENSPKGYTFVVDLKYPKELDDLHNDYPLAPENIEITRDMTLQYYVKMGIEITKIHMVLEFDQSPWLAPFINCNTDMRKNAKNEFEKDFFKFMNNSVYGKTMENIQNYTDIKLIKLKDDWQSECAVIKNLSKPRCKDFRAFNDNLCAVHLGKEKVVLNKSMYVGSAVLDLSKLWMYQYWYDYVKVEYDGKASLLYTDTDSLVYEIETEDIYTDMAKNSELFDFSNYPNTHPLYNEENKAVIGKFKDECCGMPMWEFIGLRAKMYAFEIENGQITKKAKGISKNVVTSA